MYRYNFINLKAENMCANVNMIPYLYLKKQICGDKTPQIVTQQQHKKIKIRKKKKKIWTFSLDQTLSII